MKILQLSPRFAFPEDDGGKIVLANTFKFFSKFGAKVTFFCFNEDNISTKVLNEAEKFGEVILYGHSIKNTTNRIFRSVLFNKSLYLLKHYSDDIYNYVEKLYLENKYDIIHCEHTAMAPIAIKLKKKYGVTIGLRLHNIEYRIWQLYAENLPLYNPKKLIITQQAKLLKFAESKIYSDCDVCFAITDDEKDCAIELSQMANVITSSVGVDIDIWQYNSDAKKDSQTMILATTYKWFHNVDGLKWFIIEVLPILREKLPDAKLKLLGKEPPEWLNGYKSQGVEVVGYVDKVQPYFDKANVYIAPLFVGAGIRIKILEAMAMGLPVVATSVSAAGIKALESDGLFITDDPNETANHLFYLLSYPDKSLNLGQKAYNYIKNNFSWDSNVNIMLNTYKELISK